MTNNPFASASLKKLPCPAIDRNACLDATFSSRGGTAARSQPVIRLFFEIVTYVPAFGSLSRYLGLIAASPETNQGSLCSSFLDMEASCPTNVIGWP